jgi:hypothetical protein
VITDCAVCHVPERESQSIYRLLPAQSLAIQTSFDDGVPETERSAWSGLLDGELAMAPAEVHEQPGPDTPLVTISITLVVEEGRADNGAEFYAARSRAVVTLHRARVEVVGAPGVAVDRPVAIRKAMKALAAKVGLVLTW